jgi:hypothetical protein
VSFLIGFLLFFILSSYLRFESRASQTNAKPEVKLAGNATKLRQLQLTHLYFQKMSAIQRSTPDFFDNVGIGPEKKIF